MRTRRVVKVLVSGMLVVGSYAAVTPAASAAAHPESLTYLSTYFEPVTSSTGQHLMMSLNASRFATNTSQSDKHSPGTVSITLSKPKHTESHSWTFPLSGGSFSTNSDGEGSITTGSQLGSYGAFSLTLDPGSSGSSRSCDNHNFQDKFRVKVKGSLTFDSMSTGSKAWGTVSSSGLVFRHGTLIASHGDDAEEACAAPFPCLAGISWTASHGEVTLSGSRPAARHKGSLNADRFVSLSAPSGATRTDDITVLHQPMLLSKGKRPTLTIESAGNVVRGAATIASKHKSRYSQSCKGGHQQKGHTYTGLYNIADVALSFKAQVFGRIELSTVHGASFSDVHVV